MTRSTRNATSAAAPLDDADASMQVLRQFRQIFNAVKTHFRQVESKAGLGGAQVWALGLIRENPGIGVSELACRMDVHQSTASNLVRALVDKDLIVTAKDDVDRRSVQLKALPAGARVLRASPGPFEGVLPGALKALDPELLLRLHADLGVLIRALQAEGADHQTPLADL
jgi:DNA-binding MarR family transcriptional regulator